MVVLAFVFFSFALFVSAFLGVHNFGGWIAVVVFLAFGTTVKLNGRSYCLFSWVPYRRPISMVCMFAFAIYYWVA